MNQDQAFDILTMGKNVLLTGAAGSGKTFLVNRFITYCHAHKLSVAITASTGIAATHIGGMTIHSWSGLGIKESLSSDEIEDLISREYLMKRFARTSILIIDEVSMLSGEFLSTLDMLLRAARVSLEPFGGLQVVLVGDFYQLPPVSRGQIEYAFEHRIWKYMGLTPCVLSTQFRQESENDPLLGILQEIRSGNVTETSLELLRSRDLPVFSHDHTELLTKNISVDVYNADKLSLLESEPHTYQMKGKGGEKFVIALKKGCLAPETLVLKIGARVMFVKNNFEEGYMNGSIGHVVGFEDHLPVVELLDGKSLVCSTTSWSIEENGKIKGSIDQIPLRLAWAITIHKSQGLTLDTAVMNLCDAFVPGQGYVALSRVKSLDGLILRGFNSMALQIDPRIRAYDDEVTRISQRVASELSLMSQDEISEKRNAIILGFGGELEPLTPTTLQDKYHEKGNKIPSHEETLNYLLQGISFEEISRIRDIKLSTIIAHIEKLFEENTCFDLAPYFPEDLERLNNIHQAFVDVGTYDLSPVRRFLTEEYSEEYSFDEIRFARLFLQPEHKEIIEKSGVVS